MKFVDLKLPSGLLWSTTNLGADHPFDNGARFTESEAIFVLNSIKSTPFRFPTFKEWAELKRYLIEAKHMEPFDCDTQNVFTTMDWQLIVPCNGFCWPGRQMDFGYWCERDDRNCARRLAIARDSVADSREWVYNMRPYKELSDRNIARAVGIRLVADSYDALDTTDIPQKVNLEQNVKKLLYYQNVYDKVSKLNY